MPEPARKTPLRPILDALARFPAGASVEEIRNIVGPALSRRTLQRWLALAVEAHEVIHEGEARARRYCLPTGAGKTAPALASPERSAFGLQVSQDGNSVRKAVRAPIHERQPVGYHREFLDGYRPNETAYLPKSLRQHLAEKGSSPGGELPAGTHARQMFNRLLIDLSWNSSRLEGNTYSLLETERLLEFGKSAEGKDAREAQMILNHKIAIELLVDRAEEIGFNRYTLLNLHAALADNLLSDPQAGGRLRAIPVTIGGTVFHPLEGPQLIEECFDQILATATAIRDPFEQAFFVMVHLPYLQPFEDVNKRVSRLSANIPLIRRNLCPLSFVDVPERDYIDGMLGVYELNRIDLLRDVFVWAYERSCARYAAVRRSLGEPDPFRLKYRRMLSEIIEAIIRGGMDRSEAIRQIRHAAKEKAPEEDRNRLIELVETEVMSLHEGNFARYHITPAEYHGWRSTWR